MNNNASGSQPATSRKELKFSQSKDNLDRSQHLQQPQQMQVNASVSQNHISPYNGGIVVAPTDHHPQQ